MWFEAPYKISVYHSPAPDNAHRQGEIYHLDEDPNEMENLWDAAEMRNIRDRYLLKAMDWLTWEQIRGRSRGQDASPHGFQAG